MNNVAPFTNGNGTTTLQILERLIHYLNESIVDGVNTTLESVRTEYAELYNAAKDYVDANVEQITAADTLLRKYVIDSVQEVNNRIGAPEIQRRTLSTASTVISVDPLLPNNHVLHYVISQDATGGRNATFHADIDATDFKLDKAANAKTVFSLIPMGGGKYKLVQLYSTVAGGSMDTSLAMLIATNDTLASMAVKEIVETSDTAVRADLTAAIHDLESALRSEVAGLASDGVQSDGELRDSVKSAARAAIMEALTAAGSAERERVGAVAREAVSDTFHGPLRPWGNALADTSQAPAIWVALGSSTTQGFGVVRSLGYVGRIAGLLTRRTTAGNAVRGLDDATVRPNDGVHVYDGIGVDSATYLSASRIAALGVLRPQLITHMIGSNDYASQRSLNDYKANLRSWHNQIKNVSPNTVHVYIHQQPRNDISNPVLTWTMYGNAMKEVAEELGAVFVNVAEQFGGRMPDALLVNDNIHLNGAGYAVLSHTIAQAIGVKMPYMANELQTVPFQPTQTVPINTPKSVASGTIKAAPYVRIARVTADVFGYGNGTMGTQGPEWGMVFRYADDDSLLNSSPRVRMLNGGVGSALTQSATAIFHIEPNRAVNVEVELHSVNSTTYVSGSYSKVQAVMMPG